MGSALVQPSQDPRDEASTHGMGPAPMGLNQHMQDGASTHMEQGQHPWGKASTHESGPATTEWG